METTIMVFFWIQGLGFGIDGPNRPGVHMSGEASRGTDTEPSKLEGPRKLN